MKTLLTFIATIFAFTAFAQGPVLRTPYTVNTADFVTNIVRNIGTNSTIHAGKLAPGGTLPALNGSALTSLNGTAIASGTVADARLSANIPKKDAVNVFSASNYISAGMFGDLTVQNNIVGQGNISLNGLLGDPNFATVSLDTSTGDFLTAGSIYLTSGAEMIFGNGGGLSNLPSASLVGALPAIDGSLLTGISGSGITAAQLQPNLTNLISLVDGTKVARSNLVIFTMGDSRWLTERAIKILTNRPEFYGAKAHINVVTEGGSGTVYATNSWRTNGAVAYSNVVNLAAGDVPIMIDHCSINDAVNGFMSNDTNGSAFYYSVKTNFYATQLIPLGFKVFPATIDITLNNGDPSNGFTDDGFHIYNNLLRTRTNYTAGIIELQLRTPNLSDTAVYADGIHPTYAGYAQWADALAHDLQFGANRMWVSTYRANTNIITRAFDGTLIHNIEDGGGTTTPLNIVSGSGSIMSAQANDTPLTLRSPSGSTTGGGLLIERHPDDGGADLFFVNTHAVDPLASFNLRTHINGNALVVSRNLSSLWELITRADGSLSVSNAPGLAEAINISSNSLNIKIPALGGGGNQTVLVDNDGLLSAGAGGGGGLDPRFASTANTITAASNVFTVVSLEASGPITNNSFRTTANGHIRFPNSGASANDVHFGSGDNLGLYFSGGGIAVVNLGSFTANFGTDGFDSFKRIGLGGNTDAFLDQYQPGIVGLQGAFNTNSLGISSNTWMNVPVVGRGKAFFVSSNGWPYVIWKDISDALHTNDLAAVGSSGTTNVVNDGNSVIVTDPDGTTRLDALAASTKINNDAGTTILEGQSSGNGDTTIGSHGGTAQIGLSDAGGGTITFTGNTINLDTVNVTTLNAGSSSIKTNTAAFDVDITAFVVGTRYTNSTRRTFVTASFTLNGAAAGTAAVTLSAEQAGVTNMVKISAGPLASLSTIEQLSLLVGPGAFYYFTDATTGTGASVAIVTGTSSRTDW